MVTKKISNRQRKYILLVEDNKTISKLFDAVFSGMGDFVFIVENASDAIDVILNCIIWDYIILDYDLKNNTKGLEVLIACHDFLEKQSPNTIVYANSGGDHNNEKLIAAGAHFILERDIEKVIELFYHKKTKTVHPSKTIENALSNYYQNHPGDK